MFYNLKKHYKLILFNTMISIFLFIILGICGLNLPLIPGMVLASLFSTITFIELVLPYKKKEIKNSEAIITPRK